MGIAITLQDYLDKSGIDYDILPHSHTTSSIGTAKVTGISGDYIAKSVILEDEDGYIMAVIPATYHVELGKLSHQLERRLGLATELELAELFVDCNLGAIPPIGEAYHLDVVIDDSLSKCPDVYFEAGDHADLIHMRGYDFQKLMQNARHSNFSRRI